MTDRMVEGFVLISSMSLVATLVLVIMMLAGGTSHLKHPQATRYIIVLLTLPFLSPAWWLLFSGSWSEAYQQLGDWWDVPVIGWISVIGFWCSVCAPLSVLITLIVIQRWPASNVYDVNDG